MTGRILAVSRRDDPSDFGLPGGTIEKGEAPAEAAARELREETGAVIDPASLRLVYARRGCVTFEASLFHIKRVVRPRRGETGRIAWVEADDLLRGCFGKYNRKLLRALGRW